MKVLTSNNEILLNNIIDQINVLCGWPDSSRGTVTATSVSWSTKANCFWCSVDDSRILSVINSVNLGGLLIQDLDISYFENQIIISNI